jgi:hypothetical protein
VRGDEKPLQAGSSSRRWFRAQANRGYPEGIGCYRAPARHRRLAGPTNSKRTPNHAFKQRDKASVCDGEAPPGKAGNLPKSRRCDKPHRWQVN